MLCRHAAPWLYRSERNFSWESGIGVDRDYAFMDTKGKVRLIIETTGRVTVTRGYAWNGCSPKVCFMDFLIGTPDGAVHAGTGRPKTYYASMVHDALYQFLREQSPLSRAQADRCFLRLMAESAFVWRRLYWLAVRLAGRLVWHGKHRTPHWTGRRVTIAELA